MRQSKQWRRIRNKRSVLLRWQIYKSKSDKKRLGVLPIRFEHRPRFVREKRNRVPFKALMKLERKSSQVFCKLACDDLRCHLSNVGTSRRKF